MSSFLVPLLIVLVPGAFFVLAFIAGMLEKHPVAMFKAAEPSGSDRYVAAMVKSAWQDHRFSWRAAGEHMRFPTIHAALLLSPDLTTLAIVASGTIIGIATKKTILLSQLSDGSALITIDEAGTAELDPGTRRQILMNADFAELWRAHAAALPAAGDVVLFPADASWADVDAIYRRRIDRIVAARLARFTEFDQSRYRYTPVGAFRASIVHGFRQVFTPKNHVRQYKRRPGAKSLLEDAS